MIGDRYFQQVMSWGTKNFKQKKAEKLSQCFGPTSTYEKQPFEKGNKIKSNAVPVIKMCVIVCQKCIFISNAQCVVENTSQYMGTIYPDLYF